MFGGGRSTSGFCVLSRIEGGSLVFNLAARLRLEMSISDAFEKKLEIV
jgi:hypothetical protein